MDQQRIPSFLTQAVERNHAAAIALSDDLAAHPELPDQEFRSSQKIVSLLEQAGYQVEYPYLGYPTGFHAVLDNGDGPSAAILVEYDALPGLGHACGHNVHGSMAVLAALALAELRDRFQGQVHVFGTPAEEEAGAKVGMADQGAFDGMALAAPQAAIWTYGNSGNMAIDQEDPFTSYYQAKTGKNWRDLDSREWALTKALYDYLITQTEAPTHKNTLINENNFATNASLAVGQQDEDSGKYEADLTFTLAVMPDTESDDLLVHVVVDGEIVETRRLAGDDSETQYGVIPRSEDGSYTLSGLKLADGVNIDLQLTGTQNIGEGVYLFTSEVRTEPVGSDENGEPVVSSQTFVGIESGRQMVDLSVSLNFTVNEATADVVTDTSSVTEQKVDTAETSRTDITTSTEGRAETAVTVTTVQQNDREWEVTWEKNYTYPDPEPVTPVEPEDPEERPKPSEQPAPPDNLSPTYTPASTEKPPVEDISEPEAPSTDITAEGPDDVAIPNEDAPATNASPVPAEKVIDEDVPKTGDASGKWYLLLAASLIGLGSMFCLEIRNKNRIRR